MPPDPGLFDAIKAVVESRLVEMHVALPARVEKYDRSTMKAEVTPALKKSYTNGDIVELPVIVNVPVVWPRTSEFVFDAPLAKGDTVLLVFCERSLDAWLSKGGIVTPTDRRKFDLSDAVAIPGLFSFKQENPAKDDEGVSIRYKDASITIGDNGTVDINDGNLTVEV